ncbi:MAG: hypothetical protein R3Y32_00330 [Bacillota bacterium]
MNIRIMGKADENKRFIQTLQNNENIEVVSISSAYANRGMDVRERIYIELAIVNPCEAQE